MNNFLTTVCACLVAAHLLGERPAAAQAKPAAQAKKTVTPDLSQVAAGKGWKVINRSASALKEDKYQGVRFDARAGDGFALLENSQFTNGVIEFDVRGKDVVQQSFVGVVFHADAEAKTADAVYFRPFNFKTPDPDRRSHAVQYISVPDFPWQKLRQEHPGKYEQPVDPAPDPNGWFHVRVVVDKGNVEAFVDNEKVPSLRVQQLGDPKGKLVGLWVGNNSDGDFANLKITPRLN